MTSCIGHKSSERDMARSYLIRMTWGSTYVMSSGWLTIVRSQKLQYVIRMTYDCVLCHPDEITMLIPKSSGWLRYRQNLIWMTYEHCSMSSGWIMILPYVIRVRWLIWSLSHPDDLTIASISSRWLKYCQYFIRMIQLLTVSHLDDLTFGSISFRWLNYWWYLIRMTYGHCSMSSARHIIPSYVIRIT